MAHQRSGILKVRNEIDTGLWKQQKWKKSFITVAETFFKNINTTEKKTQKVKHLLSLIMNLVQFNVIEYLHFGLD